MTAQLKIEHIADADVHHSQETLIPSLELALVENLDGYDRRVLNDAICACEPQY